jgi:hypothetical protein
MWNEMQTLPLADFPSVEKRIMQAARSSLLLRGQAFSERALARWIVAQSFIFIELDASDVVEQLYAQGTVYEDEHKRLRYKFLTGMPLNSPECLAVSEATEAADYNSCLLTSVSDGGCSDPIPSHRIPKRSNGRIKIPFQVAPTFSPQLMQKLQSMEDGPRIARLQGRKAPRSNEHKFTRDSDANGMSMWDDDPLYISRQGLREDAQARRKRCCVRQQARSTKRSSDLMNCC